MMDHHPKCKICGEKHALGGCPSFETKSNRDSNRDRGAYHLPPHPREKVSFNQPSPARSSVVEPAAHNGRVAGSSPAAPIKAIGFEPTKATLKALGATMEKADATKLKAATGRSVAKKNARKGVSKPGPSSRKAAKKKVAKKAAMAPKTPKARDQGAPKVGRPRAEDRDKTLTATQPWKAAGMSKASWYRKGFNKTAGK